MRVTAILSQRLVDSIMALCGLCVVALFIGACGMSTQLGEANRLAQEGKYQDALSAYLLIIQKSPGTPAAREANLRIGILHEEKLERPDDAIKIYSELARQYAATPQATEALWRLGTIFYKRSEYGAALNRFTQIVMDSSSGRRVEEARLKRADCFAGMKRYHEALEVYEDFPKRYPNSPLLPEVQLRHAELLISAFDDRDQAVALMKSIAATQPDSPQASLARRRLEELQAVAEPTAPLEEGGIRDIGPRTRPDARQTLYSWGPSAIFGVNVKELILGGQGIFGGEELRESLAGDGALLDDAVYNMGLMFAMTGEYRKAGACLERAIELGLDEPNLYQQLGICYREVGAKSEARQVFRHLYQLDPDAIARLVREADQQLAQGKPDVARQHYEVLQGISAEQDSIIKQRLAQIH